MKISSYVNQRLHYYGQAIRRFFDRKYRIVLAALAFSIIPAAVFGLSHEGGGTQSSVPTRTSVTTPNVTTETQTSSTPSSSTNQSTTSTSLQATTNVPGDGSAPQTSVKINGESVPVPSNGEVHRVIQDDNGTTTLNMSVKSGTSSNRSHSSSSININSSSNASIQTNTSTKTESSP
jgi:hypothetical protein